MTGTPYEILEHAFGRDDRRARRPPTAARSGPRRPAATTRPASPTPAPATPRRSCCARCRRSGCSPRAVGSPAAARATATVRPVIFRMSPGRAPMRSRSAGRERARWRGRCPRRALRRRGASRRRRGAGGGGTAVIARGLVIGSSTLEPALDLAGEPVEDRGELACGSGWSGGVGGDRDARARRRPASISRDRAEVGVLDRPAVALHGGAPPC